MRNLAVALLIVGAPALASAQLTWYTNQQEFERANRLHGKTLKGTETFEESTLPNRMSIDLNDPLIPGYANGPHFPNGLTGVDNMIVQSNTLGGNATEPSPRGTDGLRTFSRGQLGAGSDVVVPDNAFDSLDLIFASRDNHSGVGFDSILLGAAGWNQILVFDTTNRLLGGLAVRGNPAGDQFAGVWSGVPIHRINIYSPGRGLEGADNIQLWIPEPGTLTLLGLGGLVPLVRRRHG